MTTDKNMTPEQEVQMKIEVKYLKRSVLLMIIPVICAIVGRAILALYPNTACAVAENSVLLALWPQNLLLQDQLNASQFSPNERCTFFAMQSIFALGCYLWFALKFIDDARRTDKVFVAGFLKVAMITSAVSVLTILFSDFHEKDALSSLSLSQSIEVNIWKNIPIILLTFWSIGTLSERALAYLRSIR